VKPEWVVEVRYKTVTGDGLLRQPAFVRVRDDRDPKECSRAPVERSGVGDDGFGEDGFQGEASSERGSGGAPARGRSSRTPGKAPEERKVQLSNLNKVFWPKEGYTKGDLIEYYVSVKDWILPYLKDRPLVLTRYPDGIEGKSFYQKNAPDFIPSWVRTESIWSGSSEREIKYLVCDDEEMLVYIINSGAIPLHLWSSRVDSIQRPDWCILDLDPKGAPFKHVVILAKAIKELCDRIGLPAFVKTSGSTGLHVLIPLGGLCTYEQSRTLGHLIARYIAAEHGDISTIARTLAARKGKVYLDFLQNRHGQLLVSPYCVRPLPSAPVSAPLEWGEVNFRLDPQKFNLKNTIPRLKRMKKDPLLPVLGMKPDLLGALGELGDLTG
jgi:bifunctional non-homologous end joining protein LigD